MLRPLRAQAAEQGAGYDRTRTALPVAADL